MSLKRAYIFPGQGSQFSGMGKDLFEQSDAAKRIFEKANSITGFAITEIMFGGTDEELKQTKVTQPAILFIPVQSLLRSEKIFIPTWLQVIH